MIMTVIFLSWLIGLRERNKWRSVESMVLDEIGRALEHIFRSITPYYRNGLNDWFLFSRLHLATTKVFPEHMHKLIKGEIPIETSMLQLLLEKPDLRKQEFFQFGDRLSEIEIKYFRFLKPEIVVSLIKIEKELYYLENIGGLFIAWTYLATMAKEKGLVGSEQKAELFPIETVQNLVEGTFREILVEIENLTKLGIKIYDEDRAPLVNMDTFLSVKAPKS
jgi:hypothetical protein